MDDRLNGDKVDSYRIPDLSACNETQILVTVLDCLDLINNRHNRISFFVINNGKMAWGNSGLSKICD